MNEWTTNDANISDSAGKVNFKGFHGTYEITLTVPGVITKTSTIELEPGQTTAEYTLVLDCGLTWDINSDCHVNIIDLDSFANGWLTSYDFVDFASFGSEWGML